MKVLELQTQIQRAVRWHNRSFLNLIFDRNPVEKSDEKMKRKYGNWRAISYWKFNGNGPLSPGT